MRPTYFVLASILMLVGTSSAQPAFDFAKHPFFKHLIEGEWTTEGDIKFSDGHLVHNKQDWKAQAKGDNALTILGTREWAGQTIHYKWSVRRLESGAFEQVFQPDAASPNTETFTAHVSEDNSNVEMSAQMSDHSKITITQKFRGHDHDTMDVTVTLTDENGEVIYSGAAVARRHRALKPAQ